MYAYNDQTLITKLREHDVHLTQNRIAVFKLLTESKTALSVSVITKQSEILLGRISVYRALRYFLSKGIVEIVPNNKGNATYILADINNEYSHSEKEKHTYFVCNGCKMTEIIFQPISIPEKILTKYHVNKSCLILEGLCNNCKSETEYKS
jgi:Fur family ferric uptake transcriptional regulator